MYVVGAQGWLEVGEPDDCTRLEVRMSERDRPELTLLLRESGLGTWDGSDHVWLDVAQLRRQAKFGGVGPDWAHRWDAMIAYAAREGWLNEDGTHVQAHLVDSTSAPARPTSPSRRRAARLLRELSDAFLVREFDDKSLDSMSAAIQIPLGFLTEAPRRGVSTRTHHFDENFISGDASPVGTAAELERDGDDIVLTLRIARAFEGDSGHAHRGVITAAFEDAFSLVMGMVHEEDATTARLEIDFLIPIPIEQEVRIRAHLASREERRFRVYAEATVDTKVYAQAIGVMISPGADG